MAIAAPKWAEKTFTIRGTASYVSNKFSAEARNQMRAKMLQGQQAKKGKAKEARDFQRDFRESIHWFDDKTPGVPASCFRQALVSACRLVGFKMTLARLSLFVLADGEDADDATPLVRFGKGEPQYFESATRNQTGVPDIRVRGRWAPGWEIPLKLRWDTDQFSESDVRNLLRRVGEQVGIGAGRPDSKMSSGMGWGTFEVL